MLKEIRKDQYQIDAFYLRHFKVLPEGVTFDNMFNVQKEFIMLLMAVAPSIEGVQNYVNYSEELCILKETDFSEKIETSEHINKMLAKSKGISLEVYKTELSNKLRKEAIVDLKKKFSMKSDEDEDDQPDILAKYNSLAEKMAGMNVDKKTQSLANIFDKPKPDKPQFLGDKVG